MAYIDTNVFVYAVLENPANPEGVYARAMLEKIVTKKIPASTSILTWDEVIWACRKELPFAEALSKGNAILTFPNLKISDATTAVIKIAAELSGRYSLKPRDAIRAATAILNGEREIISDDSDFDKVKELRRISLAEAGR